MKVKLNKCTSLRHKAIKEYFVKKTKEPNNPCEFWNVYRPFMHSKNTKQASDIVKEDNVVNEKLEIAELLNNYFVQLIRLTMG